MELTVTIREPVVIDRVDVLRWRDQTFVRATARDGRFGIAPANQQFDRLRPILIHEVLPFFAGKDARHVATLVEDAYRHRGLYKLAGLAIWCCVGWVEFALLDLLGKVANRSVGQLLGKVARAEVPIYLSSMRRDTTPEAEIARLSERLAETGARAVKLKIGGRMSGNADASPGRTEALLRLARKAWDKDVTLYVDANGSYDVAAATEVGRVLAGYDVTLFEEPCPFDDLDATRRVAEAVGVRVAWGEQETSTPRWRWAIDHHVADVLQPDVNYNGGFCRTCDVADLANAAGLPVTPHSSRGGADPAYMLHLVSRTKNVGLFQEYRDDRELPKWCMPDLRVVDGKVRVPTGPGLGIELDPDVIKQSSVVLT